MNTYGEKRKDLEVAHIEKQLYEIPIPGLEAYTIDAEMVVRSYKRPGNPYIMTAKQNKHGGYEYNLWCYDKDGTRRKVSFSPLRLYLCACSGQDPRQTTLEKLELIKSGGEMAVKFQSKEIKHKPGNIITSAVYRSGMTEKEKQLALAARTEYELKVLQKCIAADDYTELLNVMWSYKKIVVALLYKRHSIKAKKAEELFSIAVEHTAQRIKREHLVVRNFLYTLLHCAYQARINKA